MATQTYEQLIAGANKIKENELPESNTHDLVGEQLLQMTNKMQEESTKTDNSIMEYNVSKFHPTSGVNGSNKYTLETAIAQVPSKYRSVGIKCAFINSAGKSESWEYQGSSWIVSNFKKVGAGAIDEVSASITEVSNKQGIYNVDANKPLSSGQFYTASTARAAVPSSVRKLGLIITYKTDATTSVTEQYIGSAVSAWTTEANWKNVGSEGGNKILVWNTDAATTRKQVPSKERKRGLMITYTNANGELVNEQYKSTNYSDTEWVKDSNWLPIVSQYQLSPIEARAGYVVCSTASSTVAKVITKQNFVLDTKCRLLVKMTYSNTANLVTLNINNTGAKPLFLDGTRVGSTNSWDAGDVLDIYYDGENYQATLHNDFSKILTWNTDVATTRKQIPLNKRKEGLQISYKHPDLGIIFEQYIGIDVTDASWVLDNNWARFINDKNLSKAYYLISSFPKGVDENGVNISTNIDGGNRTYIPILNKKVIEVRSFQIYGANFDCVNIYDSSKSKLTTIAYREILVEKNSYYGLIYLEKYLEEFPTATYFDLTLISSEGSFANVYGDVSEANQTVDNILMDINVLADSFDYKIQASRWFNEELSKNPCTIVKKNGLNFEATKAGFTFKITWILTQEDIEICGKLLYLYLDTRTYDTLYILKLETFDGENTIKQTFYNTYSDKHFAIDLSEHNITEYGVKFTLQVREWANNIILSDKKVLSDSIVVKPNKYIGGIVDKLYYSTDTPFDLQEAIYRVMDNGYLYISEGDYYLSETVAISRPINIIGTDNTRILGGHKIYSASPYEDYTDVYTIEINNSENGWHNYGGDNWIYLDGIADDSTKIPITEYHPIYNKQTHRLLHYTRIPKKTLEKVISEEGIGYNLTGNTLVFRLPADTDLATNPIVLSRDSADIGGHQSNRLITVRPCAHNIFIDNLTLLYGKIEFMGGVDSLITRLKVFASSGTSTAITIGSKGITNLVFRNCEAGGTQEDGVGGGSKWVDGNAYSKDISSHFFYDCWFHDVQGDGVSEHYMGNSVFDNCLFEYNGISGATPCNGESLYTSCIFRKNGGFDNRAGLYVLPSGSSCHVVAVNCISIDNIFADYGVENNSIHTNNTTVALHLYNCSSFTTDKDSPAFAFVATAAGSSHSSILGIYNTTTNRSEDKRLRKSGDTNYITIIE